MISRLNERFKSTLTQFISNLSEWPILESLNRRYSDLCKQRLAVEWCSTLSPTIIGV